MISRLAILTTLLCNIPHSICTDDGYLQFVKDSCIVKGEALNCVKYRALKIAKTTIFGDNIYNNETIKASEMFSFVPLEEELVKNISTVEDTEINQKRSFLSEWAELAKYMLRLVKEFFRVKGLKMELPDGARTLEEEVRDHNGRGKRKKLALIVPLLTLLAAAKAKLLLIPILLAVLFIKKLLIAAAFLVPSLLNTLKACKHHHHSYFGNSEASDFSSDYGYSNSYASGAGYAKDWASNRAYNLAKHRATQAPVYITAPDNAFHERVRLYFEPSNPEQRFIAPNKMGIVKTS